MSEHQLKIIKMVIEMIEQGAYDWAAGVLSEMIEDPTGEKQEREFAEIKALLNM